MILFARYLLTAGTATCVDVALVQGLLTLIPRDAPLFFSFAVTAGALAGVSVNFLLSRRYVFARDGRTAQQQFASFAAICATILLLRLVIAALLLTLLTLPFLSWLLLPIHAAAERFAHLGSVGLVTIYSFFAHKHVSFAGGIVNRLAGRSTVVG